ncbi:hypothetical protein CXG81DRAFT_18573 [Caulochytrium protostelioides]|uniref:Uncharacterized protein n=1 Tax=Caulochytrium protostelioides TaxID=1555241 RepID=A0A4P9X8U9_9FUNG|nr:hypothetical protein CXG81DRAFT_18573 [Caulochytrium protostelioides]|eukprot:RKP01695.1 hypothetical protein CXG81DRAFT_18573 [Caulochytrium protostelioides]
MHLAALSAGLALVAAGGLPLTVLADASAAPRSLAAPALLATPPPAPAHVFAPDPSMVFLAQTGPEAAASMAAFAEMVSAHVARDPTVRAHFATMQDHPSLAHLDGGARRAALQAAHTQLTSPATCRIALEAVRDSVTDVATRKGGTSSWPMPATLSPAQCLAARERTLELSQQRVSQHFARPAMHLLQSNREVLKEFTIKQTLLVEASFFVVIIGSILTWTSLFTTHALATSGVLAVLAILIFFFIGWLAQWNPNDGTLY